MRRKSRSNPPPTHVFWRLAGRNEEDIAVRFFAPRNTGSGDSERSESAPRQSPSRSFGLAVLTRFVLEDDAWISGDLLFFAVVDEDAGEGLRDLAVALGAAGVRRAPVEEEEEAWISMLFVTRCLARFMVIVVVEVAIFPVGDDGGNESSSEVAV